MTSLLECSGNLVGSAGGSVGSAFGALGSCLNDRKDAIAVATAKAWLKMNPGASWDESVAAGKKIGGVIRTASGWYALVKATYSIGAVVGDLTLDPFLRQLTFSPSIAEIKRQIAERKKAAGVLNKTYASNTPERYNNASQKFRIPYSINYRSDWRVVADPYGNLKIKDSAGQDVAALDFPLDFQPVRYMTAPVRLMQPQTAGSVHLKASTNGCSSCKLRAYTFALDYREATPAGGPGSEGFPVFDPKWDPPVRVMTILGSPSRPPTTMALGAASVIDVEAKDGNSTWFSWRAEKSFNTLEEAQAWMKTPDRTAVEQMIMSLHVD
jgi:hypothetical protein